MAPVVYIKIQNSIILACNSEFQGVDAQFYQFSFKIIETCSFHFPYIYTYTLTICLAAPHNLWLTSTFLQPTKQCQSCLHNVETTEHLQRFGCIY